MDAHNLGQAERQRAQREEPLGLRSIHPRRELHRAELLREHPDALAVSDHSAGHKVAEQVDGAPRIAAGEPVQPVGEAGCMAHLAEEAMDQVADALGVEVLERNALGGRRERPKDGFGIERIRRATAEGDEHPITHAVDGQSSERGRRRLVHGLHVVDGDDQPAKPAETQPPFDDSGLDLRAE